MSPVAVFAAAAVGFVGSGVYYTALSGPLVVARSGASTPAARPWTYGLEFARALVIAFVTAGVAAVAGIDSWLGGVVLGLALWIGFPLTLWLGELATPQGR